MLRIRELIKKVRSCKTAEEERSVINKESAEIRNMGKVRELKMIYFNSPSNKLDFNIKILNKKYHCKRNF